jgi:SAM-dependent methyltransferase
MSWDPVWEEIFRARASWGMYPPEELIRFVAAHYYAAAPRGSVAFLEIGCGPGGGPGWYIAREGFDYTGIDGSPTAIAKARARFAGEGLHGRLLEGDLVSLPFPAGSFDCVVDVAALQHNDERSAASIVGEVRRVLKPGGRHFSLTASDRCWGARSGAPIDPTTRSGVSEGPFTKMGAVRFATRDSLRRLYAAFNELEINHSIRSVADGAHEIAHFVVTCAR